MLSILIPIYNINCRGLVANLLLQCSEILKKYEVICIDDHSQDFFRYRNNSLQTLENVSYIELQENIGRAAIRNLLAEKAKYDNLLFIDADSGIIRDDFIRKYLITGNKEKVIYGGTIYQKNYPQDKSTILHWKYASKYEALPVKARNKKPFLAFMSNNFLIKKDIFMSVLFDTEHTGYGYEDTLFAEELKRRSFNISHIDNPVEHSGLSATEVFLTKTKEAMKNLALLYSSGKLQDTSLIRFYIKLKTLKLESIAALIVRHMLPLIIRNLKSEKPLLYLFQLFKYLKFYDTINGKTN